jgi:hypothetical protein
MKEPIIYNWSFHFNKLYSFIKYNNELLKKNQEIFEIS